VEVPGGCSSPATGRRRARGRQNARVGAADGRGLRACLIENCLSICIFFLPGQANEVHLFFVGDRA
jgi:hypothetical protein